MALKCVIAIFYVLYVDVLRAKWTLEPSPAGGKLAMVWNGDETKTARQTQNGARSVYKFLEKWDVCNIMEPVLGCMKEALDEWKEKLGENVYVLAINRDVIQLQKKKRNRFVPEWVDHKYMGFARYNSKIHYEGGIGHILKDHLRIKLSEGSAQIIYNGGTTPVYINYLGDITRSIHPRTTQNVFDHTTADTESIIHESGIRNRKAIQDAVQDPSKIGMDTVATVNQAGRNIERMRQVNDKIAADKTKLLEQTRARNKARRAKMGVGNGRSDEEISSIVKEKLRRKKKQRLRRNGRSDEEISSIVKEKLRRKKKQRLRRHGGAKARVSEVNIYDDAYMQGYYDALHRLLSKRS
eukprot:509229_1